jgi:hypothetical protein
MDDAKSLGPFAERSLENQIGLGAAQTAPDQTEGSGIRAVGAPQNNTEDSLALLLTHGPTSEC